ncbi:MAG: YlmH/Sll1252 family protein [Eubacterium sp.]
MDKKDEFLLARVENATHKNYEPRFFDFYDEAIQAKMERILKKSGEPFQFWGGMQNAARRMLCIYPDYVERSELKWPILGVSFKKEFPMDHRNVLGELMHLGITRECLGDISMDDAEVQVIFTERLRDFFNINFVKIKGRTIKPKIVESSEIKSFELKFKEINLVVASDRLDGIINKIWGFSRQDSITYIKQHRVRVNYEEVVKNDYRIKEGDVIALRGKGKAVIIGAEGVTKKGNIRLLVNKYI